MRLKLLHADGNTVLVGINLDDHGFDLLAGRKHVRRFVDATPGNFADVKQSVGAADINERAVIGQAADLALHGVAFLQFRVAALLAGAFLVFCNGPAIDHHVFVGHVELDDAAANFLLDQLLQFRRVVRSAARCWHEGSHADIHAQSALDHARNCADDRRLLRESFLQRRPVGGTLDFAASQFVVAFRIAPLDGDLHFVAGLRRLVGWESC